MSGNACGAHSPRSSVSHRVRTSVLAAGLLAGTLAAPARDAIAQPASPRPKWGFIDRAGKLVIEPKYDEVFPFSDGLALVKEGERYAFIDTLGRVRHAFDTTVHSVTPFAFGRALLWVSTRIGKRYGFLDTAGTWVIPPTYESASSFSDSLAVVDNQSYVDVNGKSVTIPGERVRSGSFSGGLAPVLLERKGRWGYMDRTGKLVIEPDFYDANDFVNGWARATRRQRDRSVWIDRAGKNVPPPRPTNGLNYLAIFPPGPDGLVPIESGFTDLSGTVVLDGKDKWEARQPFSSGIAAAKLPARDKWGYINRDGTWAIQPTFDEAGPFAFGRGPVMTGLDAHRKAELEGTRVRYAAAVAEEKSNAQAALVKSLPPRAFLPDGRVRWVWYEARAAAVAYAGGNRSYHVDYAVITAATSMSTDELLRFVPMDRKRRMSLTVDVGSGFFVDTTGSPGSDFDRRLGLANPAPGVLKANFTLDIVKMGEADVPKR